MQQTAFCGRYRIVDICVRIKFELIGRRTVEVKFLQLHISTYCNAFSFEPFLADPFNFILLSVPPFTLQAVTIMLVSSANSTTLLQLSVILGTSFI